jgi:hypothetical protein
MNNTKLQEVLGRPSDPSFPSNVSVYVARLARTAN